MQLIKLLDIQFTHQFYDGLCEDLSCELVRRSRTLLQAGRLHAHKSRGKLSVYFEADENAQPLASLPVERLQFWVLNASANFAVFTEQTQPIDRLPVYRNLDIAAALDPVQLYVKKSARFSHLINASERPLSISLRNSEQQLILQSNIPLEPVTDTLSIQLDGYPAGLYYLDETVESSTEQFPIAYFPDAPNNAIALLEIQLVAEFYTTPAEFTVDFAARQDTLNYYVLASNYSDTEFADLALQDVGFSEQSRAQIQFSRVNAQQFEPTHVPAQLLTTDNTKAVLFHSQSPVTRTQQGPKKLQLQLDGDVLIPSLPTPGSRRIKADFFIHVAKP